MTNQKVLADQPKDCTPLIKACDKVIEKKNQELTTADLAIKMCQHSRADMINEIEDLRDKNSSFLHNPFVMALIGVAGGIILSQTVFKK